MYRNIDFVELLPVYLLRVISETSGPCYGSPEYITQTLSIGVKCSMKKKWVCIHTTPLEGDLKGRFVTK